MGAVLRPRRFAFLTQGTVKAHVRRIYQKVGVRSRTKLDAALRLR